MLISILKCSQTKITFDRRNFPQAAVSADAELFYQLANLPLLSVVHLAKDAASWASV